MSFTAQNEGGSYKQYLRALIGATNSDTNRIGYRAATPVSGYNYHYSVAGGGSVLANVSYINHSTLVLDSNGDNPHIVQPYTTVYFWKRIA